MSRHKQYRPPVDRSPAPTPGLSPESIAALSPAEVSARVAARETRETVAVTRHTAGRLADRVRAVTPPERPATPATTPDHVESGTVPGRGATNTPTAGNHTAVVPNGSQGPGTGSASGVSPETRTGRGPIVVPRRPSTTAPTFDETDAAALLRLLNRRPADDTTGGTFAARTTSTTTHRTTRKG